MYDNQPIPPGQQHVHGGNRIVRGLGKRDQQWGEGPAQSEQFEVQSQHEGVGPDRDRMVREGEANPRVER